jgi:hypothetical protein
MHGWVKGSLWLLESSSSPDKRRILSGLADISLRSPSHINKGKGREDERFKDDTKDPAYRTPSLLLVDERSVVPVRYSIDPS